MKQKLHILLYLLLTTISSSAYDFSYSYKGQTLYFNNTYNNTCEVTKMIYYATYSGDIEIPEFVYNNEICYKVTGIGYNAFSESQELTSVIMPNSISYISSSAFYNCQNLKDAHFSNTLTRIGDQCFYDCRHLQTIDLPNTLTDIGKNAFGGCSGLESFRGKYASSDNRCLIIDGTLVAFARNGLTTYIIPNKVTKIGDRVFDACHDLKSISFPKNLTSIGTCALRNCINIESIQLPESINEIGGQAFENCRNLKFVKVFNSNPSNIKLGICLFNESPTSILYVPKGSKALYEAADQWKTFANIVELEPTSHEYLTYEYVNDSQTSWKVTGYTSDMPTEIEIPAEHEGLPVTAIGDRAFLKCSSLTSITIPNSVTSIGDYALYYCSGLRSITISNSVTSIGDWAFAYCSGLTDVTISDSLTSIGYYVFLGCSGLTSIIIPNSLTSISVSAFNGCSGLTSITIPNSVTSICYNTFNSCSGLTSIILPESITSIGDWAFCHCSGLTEVTCLVENPSQITMGYEVFYDIPTSISTLYVPKGSKALYEAADQWKEFGNIVEINVVDYAEGYEIGIDDMVISPVDITLVPVNMVNSDNVTSMQFDIHLPEGLALAKDDNGYAIGKTSRLDNSFVIGSNDYNGAVRVLVYSSSVNSVNGNEGAVIELPIVLTDQSANEGDTFEVILDNISVTMTDDFKEKFVANASATLTVGKRYTLGDVNNDGRYSAADVSMVVSYVLGMNPNGGIIEAADVNEDGRISAADVSILVYYVLTGREVNAPRRIKALDANTPAAERSEITVKADGNLALSISGISGYASAQFDIELPEGVAVKNVSLLDSDGTGHSVAFSQTDSTARVLAYSPLNRNFGCDATFEIELDGSANSNIAVDGIRLVEVAGNNITETGATGCSADFDISGLLAGIDRGIDIKATAYGVVITASEECDITISDALGRVWNHHLHPGTNTIAMNSGVYFINNKKVIIK